MRYDTIDGFARGPCTGTRQEATGLQRNGVLGSTTRMNQQVDSLPEAPEEISLIQPCKTWNRTTS